MTNTTSTTATKMTKAMYFNAIRKIVEASEVENKEGALAFIDHELELLARKSGSKKPTENQKLNEALKETIKDALIELAKPVTISELQDSFEELSRDKYQNQKLSALMNAMVRSGVLVKTTDKKKSYFSVA